jgi:small basic protein (TIGR04137 family)
MSIHSSLRGVDTLRGERSVLTRTERIKKLAKDGKLDPETDTATGLPKVRTKFKVVSSKKQKALEAGETPAAEGAAPAPEGE